MSVEKELGCVNLLCSGSLRQEVTERWGECQQSQRRKQERDPAVRAWLASATFRIAPESPAFLAEDKVCEIPGYSLRW